LPFSFCLLTSAYGQLAYRTNPDIFFYQQSNPEKREKCDQKDGEGNPSGLRYFSLEARVKLAAASRAAVILRQMLRLIVCERLMLRRIMRLKRIVERLNLRRRLRKIHLLGFLRLALGNLKFVRFPRIRSWRRKLVITTVRVLLGHKFCPAKAAEITVLIINLSAILAL
jgi:hypothetical protein